MNDLNNQSINPKSQSEAIKDEVAAEIFAMGGERPNLAVLVFGDIAKKNEETKTIEEEGKKVGVDTHVYYCNEDISESEVLEMIECLNDDEAIDAIYVQAPLPSQISQDIAEAAISSIKDVSLSDDDSVEVPLDMKVALLFKRALAIYQKKK